MDRKDMFSALLRKYKSQSGIARGLGISRQAVSQWKGLVPSDIVLRLTLEYTCDWYEECGRNCDRQGRYILRRNGRAIVTCGYHKGPAKRKGWR